MISSSLLSLFFQLVTQFSEPGFLPKSREFNGNMGSSRYCRTCKLIRPERSSHCKVCNKCVIRLDHHCPWVNNCVGKKNHRSFIFYLVFLFFTIIFGLVIGFDGVSSFSNSYLFYPLCYCYLVGVSVTIPVLFLILLHLVGVSKNMTTNEYLNYRKYSSIHPKRYPWIKSLFTNDYDLGIVHNWIDFFGGWQKSSPICSQKDFIV